MRSRESLTSRLARKRERLRRRWKGEMAFGATQGTCCFFSGIYPWSLPVRLAFDGCEQGIIK